MRRSRYGQWNARMVGRLRTFLAPVQPRWLVALSIALLVVGAVVVGRLAQRSQAQLLASSQFVTRAMELDHRARSIATSVVEAEHAVRTYVVSGHDVDARSYRIALNELPEELVAMRELVGTNPAQRANVDQLKTLVDQTLDWLGRIIAVHEAGKRETAIALLLSEDTPRMIGAIRSYASLLQLEEQRALAVRQQQLNREAAIGRASVVLVVLVTVLFVSTILVLAYQLSKIRQLARMCAWSRTIEYEGEWLTVEEYLRRRFNMDTTHGISPAEAEKMRAGLTP